KALNAIFSVLDSNQFRLIATLAYEGTVSVRLSKLQMLASQFEDLIMLDNKTILDFNAKLCDIANEVHALGKKYINTKPVRKMLRSLPEWFAHKVTSIEEAKDITKICLYELIGSLKDKCIQYRECEGYGNIQSECANILKKNGKSLNIICGDVESEDTQKEDNDVVSNHMSLISTTKQDIIVQSGNCYVVSHVGT
ncbi:hypothetical protein Pfo_011559, partial [Paulownia fortunei]